MSDFKFNYNVEELPDSKFEPIPKSEQVACFIDSEMKPTKSGDGEYLQLTAEIQGGEYAGRQIIERLNLNNPNTLAVNIAESTLKQICKAMGISVLSDHKQLRGKRFVVSLDIEEGKPYMKDGEQKQGQPQNRIKKYLPYSATENKQTTKEAATPSAKPSSPIWAQ